MNWAKDYSAASAMWQFRLTDSRSTKLDIWVYRRPESKAAIGPGCKKLANAWESASINTNNFWIVDGRSVLLHACSGP